MKRIKILLAVITILNTGFIFAQFPQKQVNSAYNYEIGKLKSLNSPNNLSEKSFNSNDENIKVDIKSIQEAKATYSIGLMRISDGSLAEGCFLHREIMHVLPGFY